ncbi:MAG: MFS transporter [Dehalococcoidia bacterium]|nr:MFS transporter [Dehalococcoidia bacterium]
MTGFRGLRKRVFYGWWMVAAGSGSALMGGVHTFGFSVFFLPLSEALGLSRTATSFVFAAARLEGGLEAPIAGRLTDRFGPRVMLMGGAALAGLGYVFLGLFARDFWSFFLIYVVLLSTGFSAGFFSAILTAYNTWFRRNRAFAIGTLGASHRAGAFFLVPLISFIVLHFGWEKGAIIAGVLLLSISVPLGLAFRRSPESMGLLPDGDPPRPEGAQARTDDGRARRQQATLYDFTLSEAMRTPAFWMVTVAQGVRGAALGAILVHAIPMLVWKGAGRQEAANLIGIMALMGAPGALVMGFVADRLNKQVMTALGALSGALALLILAGATQPWHLYGFIVFYAASEMTNPAMIGIVGDFFGRKHFGTLRGTMQFFSTFASFGMPVYAGWVFDRTGSYSWALLPFAGAAGLAAVMYLVLRPPKAPASTVVDSQSQAR